MKKIYSHQRANGHGYLRKRNKALISMITLLGTLAISSTIFADETENSHYSFISSEITNNSSPSNNSTQINQEEATPAYEETQPETTHQPTESALGSDTSNTEIPVDSRFNQYNTPAITHHFRFNKATYKSGEEVILTVEDSTVTSSTITVAHLDQVIYSTTTSDKIIKLPVDIFSPNAGFIVDVISKDADGNQLFHKVAGLSIEDDWTIYPRYGVLAGSKDNHNSITTNQVEGYKHSIDQLAQMHINNYFFYDVYNTPTNPFPKDLKRFTQDWATFLIPDDEKDPQKGKNALPVIDPQAVIDLVDHVHSTGAKAMLYNMFYAVSLNEDVPDQVKSAVIRNLQDHDNFGKTGELTATDIQQFLDPADPNWQQFIIDVMIKALQAGHFDGWQADTMGSNRVEKVATGEQFELNQHYASMAEAATKALKEFGFDFMVNDISTANADQLGKIDMAAPYSEIWGDSIAWDSTYHALTRLTERMRDTHGGKSPIIAAYTHRGQATNQLSPDNELLTDAIIAGSGGYHMNVAALNTSQDKKGFGIVQSEWYLNQNLEVPEDFADTEFNYQDFIVAYQELLRGRETLAHEGKRLFDNATILHQGNNLTSTYQNPDSVQPGTVYTFLKETKSGDRIAHLYNLVGTNTNRWNSATNSTKTLENLLVFVPLGNLTESQASTAQVFWATPDKVNQEYDISLRTATANIYYDGNAGQWMAAVEVPSLDVWDMLYINVNN